MSSASHVITAPRRPRTLGLALVEALGDRIREGRLATGDKLPTESEIMAEFGVSRTVVREAISKLQASGLVETRHGIGTFVLGLGQAPGFKITPDQFEARLRCNDATERRLRKRPVQHALAGLERISMIGRGGFGCAAPAWVAGEVRADCRSKP